MTDRHVLPADQGWHVEKEHAQRPSAKTATQAEAITRATELVTNDGGGHVIIHGSDGTVAETRTITTDTTHSAPPARRTHQASNPEYTGTIAPTDPNNADTRPTGGRSTHPRGRRAAHHATHRHSPQLDLPLLGTVTLPPPDQLAYLAGITALVAVGILEWPVAALLGAGHLLAADRNNKIIADFGEALEQA
jgi:hypothetical protein